MENSLRKIFWKLNGIAVEYNIIDRVDDIEKEFEEFFDSELSKAREEGRKNTLEEIKDTPEEWEDRIRDLILDISADRLVSSEKVVAIVQSLLLEREREVLENMRGWTVEYTPGNYKVRDFDAEIAIGKIIDRELDKLNNKKQ